FLVQRFLGLPSVRIVLADGHLAAPLDDGWCALFGDVRRLATFTGVHRLDTLVLSPLGWDSSLLDFDAWALPLVDDFRRFVLAAHGLPTAAGRRPATPRVSLVLREDYRAHDPSAAGDGRPQSGNGPDPCATSGASPPGAGWPIAAGRTATRPASIPTTARRFRRPSWWTKSVAARRRRDDRALPTTGGRPRRGRGGGGLGHPAARSR